MPDSNRRNTNRPVTSCTGKGSPHDFRPSQNRAAFRSPFLRTVLDPENSVGYICGQGLIEGRKTYVCAAVTDPQPCALHRIPCGKKSASWSIFSLNRPPSSFWSTSSRAGRRPPGIRPCPPDSARLQAGKRRCRPAPIVSTRVCRRRFPLVGVLFGQVAAALSFPLTLCDTIAMVEGSAMCIGRPDAVKVMIGETPSMEELGGARMHCTRVGPR